VVQTSSTIGIADIDEESSKAKPLPRQMNAGEKVNFISEDLLCSQYSIIK
jgi:hypothetical protein